jgi:hypothetical protein
MARRTRWLALLAAAIVVLTVTVAGRTSPEGLVSAGPVVTMTDAPAAAPPDMTAPARDAGSITSSAPVPIVPPTTAGEPVSREIPDAVPTTAPSGAPAPPWAASVQTTVAGDVTTDLGCAADTSAAALGAFFADRAGPLLGMDYQHVYPLGGDRWLWLFQDAFVDPAGTATMLGQATFVHNVAVVQTGSCFTLHHRGTAAQPASFEQGTGEQPRSTWFWPMGGEVSGDQLLVFWVQMRKDATDPGPGDGLGWHPEATWLAVYDARTLARLELRPAPDPGVAPIYGYAVASDDDHTYLFGNSFEQNLDREGGFVAGPHSATRTYLARVQLGALDAAPSYWTPTGWSSDPASAEPIAERGWTENPMQPRWLDGRWVAATKVDGYWGDTLSIDVAPAPWGPWTSAEARPLAGDSALTNAYHAQLLPWADTDGGLIVTYSRNARNMTRDAWPHPERYRIAVAAAARPDGAPD